VTNVCSSTVFDFVIHNKPCLYYNYEQPQLKKGIRDIGQNYNYVHFRSMPTKEAAVFCESKSDLKQIVKDILDNKVSNVSQAKLWYKVIAGEAPQQASSKIWSAISNIMN
jgi:CDP-glycerol glycerophosphotransferase (TagB/SpsB family)